MRNPNSYIASEEDVEIFLIALKTMLLTKDCRFEVKGIKRGQDPTSTYTTTNTMLDLNYDADDIKNELISLTTNEYIETIIDDADSTRPPFWVFGKEVKRKDIYIKVKIKIANSVFCVSFHYPEYPLKQGPFSRFEKC